MVYIVNRFRILEEEIGYRYDFFKFDFQDLYLYYNILFRFIKEIYIVQFVEFQSREINNLLKQWGWYKN